MDRELEHLVALLSRQVHQAPGSEASTRRALAGLGPLPARPRIADLGCGRGASALVLAEATGGHVLAVDQLPGMVEAVRAGAARRGLADRVDAQVGDMASPPVPPGSLDLVWSEGAAYAIGLETALAAWHPLLCDGGGLGITELCFIDDVPDGEAVAAWRAEYPAMRSAAGVREAVEAAGFVVVDSFLLPEADWEAYYGGLDAAAAAHLAAHPGDPVAAEVVAGMQAEASLWRRWRSQVGYLFVVARKGASR